MGVSEILVVLDNGNKLTSAEIAKRTNLSVTSVKKGIKRLIKDVSENVEFRVLTPEEKEERYGRKIGVKIHLYWLNR